MGVRVIKCVPLVGCVFLLEVAGLSFSQIEASRCFYARTKDHNKVLFTFKGTQIAP